jgi:hypothetical protein
VAAGPGGDWGSVAVFAWQRFSTGDVDKGVRNAGAPVVKHGDYLCESGGDGRAELRGMLCISIQVCG